jgi:Zn-dependent metalloprotease
VDDAEDAEVIVHEYGHSVQDNQVPGFGSSPDAGAIGEGFGDYLAVTVSEQFAPTADEPCVADWDSTSYTSTVPHCLRRVDGTKHYPEDLAKPREVHADGEIWSRALWDINQALGAKLADTIIIDAQFGFDPSISMPDAATATVATARQYGARAERAVRDAFHTRGLA